MIYKGEKVSSYKFYKNVYKEDGLKWTLRIFYSQIWVWGWITRQNNNARVYVFKEDMRSLIKKRIKKVF